MKTRLALPFLIAALSITSACAPKHRGDEPSRAQLKEDTVVEFDENDAVAPTENIDIDMGKDTTGETRPMAGSPEADDQTDDSAEESEDQSADESQDQADAEEEFETDTVDTTTDETGANEQVLANDANGGISLDETEGVPSETISVQSTFEEMAAKRKAAPKKAAPKKAPAKRVAPKKAVAKKGAVARKAPAKKARPAAPSMDRSKITFGTMTGSSLAPKSNEATRFAPASITKLVTTGMALERLGHNFTFKHKIAWRYVQGSNAVATNLTWFGEGDPTLGHSRFEADKAGMATLKKMAAALKQKGIKSVQGPITLRPADNRMQGWFVAAGVPDWEPFTCYGAPPRAFNIFRNCASAKAGMRDTETRAKQAFVAALKSQGITVNEAAKPQVNPAVSALAFSSAPMPRLLYWMNKSSDNLIAESLFKAVARTVNTPNLQQNGQGIYKGTIASWMTQMGTGGFANELSFLDGSGLTPNNVVTPRAFVQMLKRYVSKNYFADLWQSLPIAGVDGTLANRAKNPQIAGKVRAKTGTLTGYYQLAGYIPRLNADGKGVKELVPFAILTKAPGNEAGRRAAHRYQDDILVELSRKVNGK